ncbi:hypothetical protein [uncultured Amnibacterium sp.]|uniref:hypothetical protein n=1 Tax=uncultured Amnibacterium sp. TaxID=1631851 RepID=UPI0035CB219F
MLARLFLALAAAWDLFAAAALLLLPVGRAGVGTRIPTSRARGFGGVVLAFALLYAAGVFRPARPLLIVSAAAKTVGATSGVVGAIRRQRDIVTAVSLVDAAWVPGFVALAFGRTRR